MATVLEGGLLKLVVFYTMPTYPYTLDVANTTNALGINFHLVNTEALVLDKSNHYPRLPFRFFGPDILGYNLDK
jgi:hypothetical protein